MPDTSLKEICRDLQDGLDRGWREFQASDYPTILARFTEDVLGGEKFFQGPYRQTIPHPANERAARKLRKYAPEVLLKHGVQFDARWPGNFAGYREKRDVLRRC